MIEVVVAFAIFALSIGTILELFRSDIRRSQHSAVALNQALIAQSVLTQLRVSAGPWAEKQSGITDGGVQWELTVSPYQARQDAQSAWRPMDVTITVQGFSRSRKAYSLKSIELMYTPKAPT